MEPFITALSQAIAKTLQPEQIEESLLVHRLESLSLSNRTNETPVKQLARIAYYEPWELEEISRNVPLITQAYLLLPDNYRRLSFEIAPSQEGQRLLDQHARFVSYDTDLLDRIRGSQVSSQLLDYWKNVAPSLDHRQRAYLLARLQLGLIPNHPLNTFCTPQDIITRELELQGNAREIERDMIANGLLSPEADNIRHLASEIVNRWTSLGAVHRWTTKTVGYPELVDILKKYFPPDPERARRSIERLPVEQIHRLVNAFSNPPTNIDQLLDRLAALQPSEAFQLPFPGWSIYKTLTGYP